MLKKIKEHKEEIAIVAIYVGAIIGTAVITYAVTNAVHKAQLEVANEMLSNPWLDDVRLYGITELREI
jgi:hypothetical protein